METNNNEHGIGDPSANVGGWSGKAAIVAILAVALGMAGYAWWYRYQQGRQAREFWGRGPALLIGQSPQVELLRLRPEHEPAAEAGSEEQLHIAGRPFRVVERKDVSRAKGLLHARDALVKDASFRWNPPHRDCQSAWEFAFRFSEGGKHATVALDFACCRVRLVEFEREATIVELTAKGLQEFVDRQYEDRQND